MIVQDDRAGIVWMEEGPHRLSVDGKRDVHLCICSWKGVGDHVIDVDGSPCERDLY